MYTTRSEYTHNFIWSQYSKLHPLHTTNRRFGIQTRHLAHNYCRSHRFSIAPVSVYMVYIVSILALAQTIYRVDNIHIRLIGVCIKVNVCVCIFRHNYLSVNGIVLFPSFTWLYKYKEEYKQGEMWHPAQRAEISEEICMFQPGRCQATDTWPISGKPTMRNCW
jgi:hypothetical protein